MTFLSNNENPDQNPALSKLSVESLIHRYMPTDSVELIEKIARYNKVENHEVLLSAGSSDLIEQVARLFVQPNNNVIYSNHSFIWYRMITSIIGAKANIVEHKNFYHQLDAIKAAIDNQTKVIFIDNPNNPFGTVLTHKQLHAFVESIPDSIYVVIDEAYHEYATSDEYQSCIDLIKQHKNVIVTRTFSKAYALAGLRIGYGIAHTDLANKIKTVTRPYNINSIAIVAAALALDNDKFVTDSLTKNRQQLDKIKTYCLKSNLAFIESHANFIAINLGENAADITNELDKLGIRISSLENYGFQEWIRVTTGTSQEVERFIAEIDKIIPTI